MRENCYFQRYLIKTKKWLGQGLFDGNWLSHAISVLCSLSSPIMISHESWPIIEVFGRLLLLSLWILLLNHHQQMVRLSHSSCATLLHFDNRRLNSRSSLSFAILRCGCWSFLLANYEQLRLLVVVLRSSHQACRRNCKVVLHRLGFREFSNLDVNLLLLVVSLQHPAYLYLLERPLE